MSGSVPTEDVTWAESAPGSGIVEPTTKRVAGWNPGDKPPAEWLNYWMRGVGRRVTYYGDKNVAGGIVGLHDTNVAAAWAATAGSANGLAVTGHGTGAGVSGYGGASGSGVRGHTVAGSAASAAGGFFTADTGSHGRAVWAIAGAGASGTGVFATAPSGTGQAVWAVGVSNANAIWAQGPASGVALLAEGAGSYTLDVRNNRAALSGVIARFLYTGTSGAATGLYTSVTASASGVGAVFEGATAAGIGIQASGATAGSFAGRVIATVSGVTGTLGAQPVTDKYAVYGQASAANDFGVVGENAGGTAGYFVGATGASAYGTSIAVAASANGSATAVFASVTGAGTGAAVSASIANNVGPAGVFNSTNTGGGVPLRLIPKATSAVTGGSYSPVSGDFYVDSTTNAIRYYVNSQWRSLTGA